MTVSYQLNCFKTTTWSNKDKRHLLVAGQKHKRIWAKIAEVKILESNKQKQLGVQTDEKLSFAEHISNLCKSLF